MLRCDVRASAAEQLDWLQDMSSMVSELIQRFLPQVLDGHFMACLHHPGCAACIPSHRAGAVVGGDAPDCQRERGD